MGGFAAASGAAEVDDLLASAVLFVRLPFSLAVLPLCP